MFTSLALLPSANAQSQSASVTGILTDSSGGAVVGAKVQLTNDLTKQASEFPTDTGGRFQFQVEPGDYTLHVAQTGFKAYEQKINVVPEERFALPEIKLTVGDVATTVDVQAEIAHVQTETSDKTIVVNEQQIEDTTSAGRNYLELLRSLPGTFVGTTTDGRGGAQSPGGLGNNGIVVNGGAGTFLVSLNGIASQDSGNPAGTGGYQAPSVDAIGEVQVMVSNYTAEYGVRNGGTMNIVIKNGTNQFHGTGYYYLRHEEFDSNEWFNNKNTETINGIPGQATPKPLYRYQNPGGTFGGPVYIPHHFNTNRNKLFFFYSEDDLFHKGTYGPNHYTMPTALERQGNFSQSDTTAGVQIPVYNPLAGTTANPILFPNYIVPPSQISAQGYAILNLFPMPCGGAVCNTSNGEDPTGNRAYNYTNSFNLTTPERDRILRVDAPIGKTTSFYVSALQDYVATQGGNAALGASGEGWGQFQNTYKIPNESIAVNVVHTFKPNLINELNAGINRAHQISAANNNNSCTSSSPSILQGQGGALPYACSQLSDPNFVGPNGQQVANTLPNLFPGANTLGILPNISFGTGGGFTAQSAGQTINDVPSFGFDARWPFTGTDQLTSITDTTTWIKGKHTIKGGIYIEHDSRNVAVYDEWGPEGTAWFGSDRANASDTNYPYANALIGSMFAYGQDNEKLVNHSRYTTTEFFLQDTWKATRRLTLDYGLRIQSIGQETDPGSTVGFFKTSAYNPKAAGQLLFPTCTISASSTGCPKTDLAAINPVTGKEYPYSLVGTFDPASYAAGSYPYSGLVNYPGSFWNRGKPDLGPRIGFAYDLFGDGKTAIRGGFGIFYGRASSVDQIAAPSSGGGGPAEVAPQFLAPAYIYPTFSSLQGTAASYSPESVYGGTQNILNPQTLQWSFGVQRDIGKGTILDVSYLGWVTHHNYNISGYDLNTVPLLTDWKPTPGPGTNSCGQVIAYLDPTQAAVNPTTCTGGAFLSSSLIRGEVSYEGYNNINVSTNNGESNYNALQVQINKRFGKRLQFSTNYTWARALSYTQSTAAQDIPQYLTYAPTGGIHPHVVNINYGYRLQNGTSLLPDSWKNYVTKLVLDGWNTSGVLTMSDGTWLTVSCSAQSAPIGEWTGTPVDAPSMRCEMNGSLWLPAGATPASVGSTSDPRLWFPLNGGPSVNEASSAFSLPPANSLGIGNLPPAFFLGPGLFNADLSAFKQITLGKETRVLEFRADAFNTLNHFNPNNPATGLTYNFATGAQSGNSTFGQVTSAQNTARHMELSLRLRF